MQILSVVFASSRQINKQKYAKTIKRLCAGNEIFVTYQTQGGRGLNPNPLEYAVGCMSVTKLKLA